MDLQLAKLWKKHRNVDDENVRKCVTISDALGEIGKKGKNNSITSILNSEYYQCLSEDYKAQVFSNFEYSLDGSRYSTFSNGIMCLVKLAERDIPTYIQQILPYMPLHTFKSSNLPPGLPWIESEKWMRDMLVKHKVRWDPDSNAGNNESVLQKASDNGDETQVQNDEDVITESVNEGDTIQKLRDLAFTMMAAELFHICCNKKAIRCCRYLLRIAPNLVTIEAGHYNTVALCTALMSDSLDVVNLLQKQQAPIGNIARAAYLVSIKSRNLGSFQFISNALKRKEARDEVRLYRDEKGNTILHLLHRTAFLRNRWSSSKNKLNVYVQSWFQLILEFGVDPRVMNDRNETALGMLVEAYVPFFRVPSADLTELLLQNLERILPSWGVALPSGFPRKPKTYEDWVIMLCKIAELLLNDEHAFKSVIHSMQDRTLFCVCKSTNCQLCLPYVSLFYRAMCKGIDMYSNSGEPLRPSVWELFCKDHVSYLLRLSTESGPNACCHWALFELLVHCGNDAFSHMHMEDFGDRLYSPVEIVSESLTELAESWLQDKSESIKPIHSIMSMLSMYAPSILHGVLPELLAHCTAYGKSDEYEEEEEDEEGDVVENQLMKTIVQMQEKIESVVRPLKLLCRITIRASVTFKDIEKLPYPEKLKSYLRIGDIPESHVIHQIIKEIDVTG